MSKGPLWVKWSGWQWSSSPSLTRWTEESFQKVTYLGFKSQLALVSKVDLPRGKLTFGLPLIDSILDTTPNDGGGGYSVVLRVAASERRENNLKPSREIFMKAKARI